MSLGNTYDNNKRNADVFNPTIYSQYKFNNAEGEVDKTCISFHYWNSMLKISISPKKDVPSSDGQPVFDYENGISIYLNHTKARILAEEVKHFIADPVTYDNCGVSSGQGLITISRGTEFHSSSPLIIIRKVENDGSVLSSFAYQTKTDFHFSIRGYSEDGSFVKVSDEYNNLELLQLVTVLEEFYKASTCAVAFTVMDQLKWEHNRQREWRNSVSAKLGLDTPGGGGSRNFSSSSYFNNSSGNKPSSSINNTNYTRTTLDEME